MKWFSNSIGLAVLWCGLASAAGSVAVAQTPATPPAQAPDARQSKPSPKESNPFPTDTTNIPVVPTSDTPPVPEAGNEAAPAMPAADADPAKSPDDPTTDTSGSSSDSSSSSLSGLARVLDAPDPDTKNRRNGKNQPPEHQETAKEDESVGAYYLGSHDWKAARSRFESAVVLDPDNPDVYWGLAEAQRHLGDFASAKANYQKLLDYDPDNKHAKDAKKALKDPEVANARVDAPKSLAKP